mmetsp:Transcript_19986/g.37325  ORF Transcript_19986/g.37325 Transcript_19986/m.37325 type:complete len:337 (+) Transcript_19986:250-1260(+)
MTMTTTNRSTVYQIDCEMTKKGKMFAGSKLRVCFKFGFANAAAVRAGQTGTECRGAEHQVVFIWSLTSGKQVVLVDGHEVHFSKSRRFDKFECEWEMAGGHRLSVAAHASAPLFEKKEGFRQFDLVVDGVSFWDMPKMFQLGSSKIDGEYRHVRSCPPTLGRQVSLPEECDQLSLSSSTTHPTLLRSQSSPCSISPSPSMPDLLDFAAPSTSHSSPVVVSKPVSARVTASPTSVMANPFDVYSTPTSRCSIDTHNTPMNGALHANEFMAHYSPYMPQQQQQQQHLSVQQGLSWNQQPFHYYQQHQHSSPAVTPTQASHPSNGFAAFTAQHTVCAGY